MNSADIGLGTINPPKELVQEWARGIPGRGNPERYMRECYLQFGASQGARRMLEGVLGYIDGLPGEDLDVGELIDKFEAYLEPQA